MSKEFVEKFVIDGARRNFEKDGYLAPVAFLKSGDNVGVVLLDFNGYEAKEASLNAVRQMCHATQIECVVTVAEAWMVGGNEKELSPVDTEIPPSMNPDRTENVIIMFEYKVPDRESGLVTIPIIREGEGEGESVSLGEAKWMDDPEGYQEGIMCNLLSKDN